MAQASVPAKPRRVVYQGDPLAAPPPPQLASALEEYRGRRDLLVAALQEIQALYGYLPKRAVLYAARELGAPLSRLYGVATFYNQFRLTPTGRHIIQVCRGTACHVAGSAGLLAAVSETLGVAEDETTSDGMFSLATVACLGCCSLAPAVMVNREVHGNLAVDRAGDLLDRYARSLDPGKAGEESV